MSGRQSCILLVSDHAAVAPAIAAVEASFDIRLVLRQARWEQDVPAELIATAGAGVDYILNLLSPIVLPACVLAGAGRSAINVHPAPPKWPGVGSASYALFHGDREFGVTAHLMLPVIDSGPIVRVRRFPIEAHDTCETLNERAIGHAVALFIDLVSELAQGVLLTPSGDSWERRAITRRQFERWMELSADDLPDVIAGKVRALRHTRFPGPFLTFAGYRFAYCPPGSKPK